MCYGPNSSSPLGPKRTTSVIKKRKRSLNFEGSDASALSTTFAPLPPSSFSLPPALSTEELLERYLSLHNQKAASERAARWSYDFVNDRPLSGGRYTWVDSDSECDQDATGLPSATDSAFPSEPAPIKTPLSSALPAPAASDLSARTLPAARTLAPASEAYPVHETRYALGRSGSVEL